MAITSYFFDMEPNSYNMQEELKGIVFLKRNRSILFNIKILFKRKR